MKFERHFTKAGMPVVNQIKWKKVTAEIPGTFKMENVEVPDHWSQNAINILAQKYFRKAGVPKPENRIPRNRDEANLPVWLRSHTDGTTNDERGGETSAKEVFHRLAGHWTYTGWNEGYFSSEEDAKIFYHEVYWMLAHQIAAPNSPQWFNCFSGSTRFITKEHGVTSLFDLVGQECHVWTREGWKRADIKHFGKQQLNRVTFAPVHKLETYGNTRIAWITGKTNCRVIKEVTSNHGWVLKDGTRTNNLNVGDIVKAEHTNADKESIDYRKGFQHGVIFGDGNYVRSMENGMLTFRARLCGDKKHLAWAFDKVGHPESFKGDALVRVNSFNNLKKLPGWGLLDAIPIPECNSVEYISGFLDGWIATDGSKRTQHSIRLTSRNNHKEWLQKYAAMAGWNLVGWSEDFSVGGYLEEPKTQYVFSLRKKNETIGWKVLSIEELNESDVFCAEVDDLHEFTLSDGILTGNTGLWWAYGIEGSDSGQWRCDEDGNPIQLSNSYKYPQVHACQPSWAFVTTPTGPIQIVNLNVGDTVIDKEGKYTEVTAKINSGIDTVLHIELANGNFIEVTKNHKVLVCPEYDHNKKLKSNMLWMDAGELRPGMRLMQRNDSAIGEHSNGITIHEAFLLGFLHGDGFSSRTMYSSPCIELMTVGIEEYNAIINCVHEVFAGIHYNIRDVQNEKGKDIKRITLYGSKILEFLNKFEVGDTKKEDRIPQTIMSGGKFVSRAYISAFFQAEGHINKQCKVVIVNTNKNLLEDINHLLLNMGIYSRIMPSYEKRADRQPCYSLLISYKSERAKLIENKLFLSEQKISALNNTMGIPGKNITNVRLEEIVEIIEIGRHTVWDIETASHTYLTNSVVVHNCFINSLSDNLVEENGIFDLLAREARIFKYGSGAGSNFSRLRGKNERLSGGGRSSGLMSFLDIFDKAAGAIQSGGTTRRAAKMVVLDMDHPEIEEFIDWKVREESKAAAMNVGSHAIRNLLTLNQRDIIPSAIKDRLNAGMDQEIFGIGWEEEALRTVSGQNSNNSVRPTNAFMVAVEKGEPWNLTARTDGKTIKTIAADILWNKLCTAAWACADPGIQFHDNINRWNTCSNDGPIISTNPCGEYNFLDDTACNLASMNLVNTLLKSHLERDKPIDWGTLRHATRLWLIVLDISVSMASFPSREIAIGSWKYRTTGLGYANLGAMLMRLGIPYDSDEARKLAADITDAMHAYSYLTSAELAAELGAFPRWEANRNPMADVIHLHAKHSNHINPAIRDVWEEVKLACARGFRNAQTTLIAPTGTISFVMDCDTTGIEPDHALVKFKALAGGGSMDIINQSVEPALRTLGYSNPDIEWVIKFIETHKRFPTSADSHRTIDDKVSAVFACGSQISALGHIKMMAAVQPFLSGAISKTIAMPSSATVADIDNAYRLSWNLGLKCVALYRNGSKLTQPLSDAQEIETIKTIPFHDPVWINRDEAILDLPLRGTRIPLPAKCSGYRRKFQINGNPTFLHTGQYDDGSLGEIFLELSKEGSTLRAFANAFAIAVSLGLQYGVPLEEFVEAFVHTKFEPAGIVEGHESIKIASSILDLVARELGITYLGRTDLASIQPQISQTVVEVTTQTQITHVQELIEHKITLTGELCWDCGNATLVRTGGSGCVTCSFCGANSGCS